jgi:hypothetical protein
VRAEDVLLGLCALEVATVANAAEASVLVSLSDHFVILLIEYLRLRGTLDEEGVVSISTIKNEIAQYECY